jgi:hypothetical protein
VPTRSIVTAEPRGLRYAQPTLRLLIYFEIDGSPIIIDKQTGIDICEAMHDVAVYLGYDK